MPGTGKTTTGKFLAKNIHLPFLDLDDQIVQKAGISINEIFSQHGEDYFRNLERALLLELTEQNTNLLLATGGGAPCFFDNMDFMNRNGYTIYLRANAEYLAERLQRKGTAKRPLLKDVAPENLLEEVKERLKVRETFYLQAHYVIDYNRVEPEQLYEIIRDLEEKSK
jgi:shikimate kinase